MTINYTKPDIPALRRGGYAIAKKILSSVGPKAHDRSTQKRGFTDQGAAGAQQTL